METAKYLYTEVLRKTRCLVITLDADGFVTRLDCPWGDWIIEGVETGSDLPQPLRAILDFLPASTESESYPFVYLNDEQVVDVHVHGTGLSREVILRDVSEIHEAGLKVQQKAHEVSLLLEKQSELNRQLEQQRVELERASQAKSRFIASMSHEFRTPITSIMGYADLLAKELEDKTAPAAIQRASWHLLTLVENLLEEARQDGAPVHLNPGHVDVSALLSDMRDLFSLQARSKGLELYVIEPSAGVSFNTDELRLRQVLINLLGNAIRYTAHGRVELGVDVESASLTFRVADTGPGISADDQERIFLPFERLGNSRQSGAGLGLAIARQIVDAMGGELWLESEPDRGSTFCFRLPASLSGQPGGSGDLEGLRVLLVDDDIDALEIYGLFLSDWGIRLQSSSDLHSALDLAAEHSFDLVITDLNLGDENGVDLLRFIRTHQGQCRTLLCSGAGITSDWQERFGDFADGFLLKPVRPDNLRLAMMNVLNRKSL